MSSSLDAVLLQRRHDSRQSYFLPGQGATFLVDQSLSVDLFRAASWQPGTVATAPQAQALGWNQTGSADQGRPLNRLKSEFRIQMPRSNCYCHPLRSTLTLNSYVRYFNQAWPPVRSAFSLFLFDFIFPRSHGLPNFNLYAETSVARHLQLYPGSDPCHCLSFACEIRPLANHHAGLLGRLVNSLCVGNFLLREVERYTGAVSCR